MSNTEALAAADATLAPRAGVRAVCDPNGRRWRVEGPGWTMKPEGTVNAVEAEAICRAVAQALTAVFGGITSVIMPVVSTDEIGALMRAANRVLDGIAPKAAPTLPATRSPDFTLPDLADALEREPSDFDFATALAVAPAQAWAICAAMWREVERRGADALATEGGVTLYQLAHACQGLTAISLWDYPTAESPAGRYGTSGQRLYMLMAGEGQMATIVGALRSYADDLRPRTTISAGQHPAEPPIPDAEIVRREVLFPMLFPGDELRFTPARFQAPGRDLEDDGA